MCFQDIFDRDDTTPAHWKGHSEVVIRLIISFDNLDMNRIETNKTIICGTFFVFLYVEDFLKILSMASQA